MGTPGERSASQIEQETVLVVNDRADIEVQIRRQFPNWRMRASRSYLAAIAELTRQPASIVFAYVDPSLEDLEDAVTGLREAAGRDATLLLCCQAEGEPMTRKALSAGADDYLICPLRSEEVQSALDARATPATCKTAVTEIDAASVSELNALGEIVSRLDSPLDDFLKSLAELLRTAFDADSAGVVIEESAATTGSATAEPAMTEPLLQDSEEIGRVVLGPRQTGEYSDADRAKLQHYARLIGHLVRAGLDHRRFQKLAFTDELSGLPNRRYLLQFVRRIIERAKTDNSNVTILMFDVDSFKRYNDTYGHDAGDEIIRGCGELFTNNCRDHDLVTRYGGDEFAVVFWDKDGKREPDSKHPSDVLPIIERFRRSLRRHEFDSFNPREGSRLTISGGLATYPDDGKTVEELITAADEALLRAKREGKNRIFIGGEDGGPALGAERTEEQRT